MIKATSYLYQSRHNVFYFQYRIPQKIRAICDIKDNFLRKSLKTKDNRLAIRHSKHLFVAIDSIFENHSEQSSCYLKAKKLLNSADFSHGEFQDSCRLKVKIMPPYSLGYPRLVSQG